MLFVQSMYGSDWVTQEAIEYQSFCLIKNYEVRFSIGQATFVLSIVR